MAELEIHFVAFLDILGFASMVESDCLLPNKDDAKYLSKLYQVHNDTLKMLPDKSYSIVQFSDTVVISAEYNAKEFSRFIRVISTYQKMLLKNDLLCRGGISYGKHFSERSFMFSDGLIKAYKIENTLARYPRVLIDFNLISLLYPSALPSERMIIKQDDDLYFVNYLVADDDNDKRNLCAIVERIFSGIKTNSNIKEKIMWLAQYSDFALGTTLSPNKFTNFWA